MGKSTQLIKTNKAIQKASLLIQTIRTEKKKEKKL